MDGNNESANKKERASSSPTDPPLKIIEDMLHYKILQKKREIPKTQSIADTERLWTQIETLQWVLSESRSIRGKQEQGV
jgi:CRISPR/Cas system-associated protein Cas10 (large subunit of type III CRISPR-Cas system)